MKIFFVTLVVVGMALVYGSDFHGVSVLDYNGVRALVDQMIVSLKS